MPNKINATSIDLNVQGRQGLADEVFSPGHILERTATGFKKHATANGITQRIVALENLARAGDLETAYVALELAQAAVLRPGDQFYARISAGATAVSALADLTSTGTGYVQAATTETGQELVGKSLEAVDNSGGSSDAFILVEAY